MLPKSAWSSSRTTRSRWRRGAGRRILERSYRTGIFIANTAF